MPKTVTWDYIDETSYEADEPAKALAAALEFLSLARDGETEYDDDTSPAALFVAASECFVDADEPERSLEAALEAQDAEGEAAPDKRVYLIDALLRTGQAEEAEVISKQLLAEGPADPMVHSFLGDSYDEAGEATIAQRWFNVGIRMLDKMLEGEGDYDRDELADVLESRELLILGRLGVRERAGLPSDELDLEGLEILDEDDSEG